MATGETIEVADRGRPVGLLVPTSKDPWQDLNARGQVLAAGGEGHVADDPPHDYGIDASARLTDMRADER